MTISTDRKQSLGERLVRRIVWASGLRLSETVSKDASLELIGKLRPYDSGHPLIRLGPAGDGGYLVPDDLEGISHCFSPGVANISGFERALAGKGIGCFLADYSVDLPKSGHESLLFDKKYIGSYTDGEYMTFGDWAKERLPQDAGDLLLQMDIEGAEYEVILNLSDDLLRRFRIVVIEFHSIARWFEQPFFRIVDSAFEKILRHFNVVHLHPNNYCSPENVNGIMVPALMEFTFLRKDRFLSRDVVAHLPNPLDVDNVAGNPKIMLSTEWLDG